MSRSVFNRSRRGATTLEFGLVGALRAAVGEVVRHAILGTTVAGCETAESHALARVTRGTRSVTVTTDYAFSYVVPLLGAAPRMHRATVTSPS